MRYILLSFLIESAKLISEQCTCTPYVRIEGSQGIAVAKSAKSDKAMRSNDAPAVLLPILEVNKRGNNIGQQRFHLI